MPIKDPIKWAERIAGNNKKLIITILTFAIPIVVIDYLIPEAGIYVACGAIGAILGGLRMLVKHLKETNNFK